MLVAYRKAPFCQSVQMLRCWLKMDNFCAAQRPTIVRAAGGAVAFQELNDLDGPSHAGQPPSHVRLLCQRQTGGGQEFDTAGLLCMFRHMPLSGFRVY